MLHIGIDARLTAYRDGGISTYIRQIVHALEALVTRPPGVRITVAHSRRAKPSLTQQFNRINLWTPPHHRLERLTLSLELARHRLDVLHSPDFIPPYRGARHHIVTVHDLTFLHYPQYLTAEARKYYNDQIAAAVNHADHILVVSEATRQDLIEMLHVSPEKMTLQPHGVNPRYRPIPPEERRAVLRDLELPDRFILHVGTLEPRKNILGLAEAYRVLCSTFPDAPPIVLVGRPGWLFEKTRERIEHMQLQQRILLRTQVDDEQLPAVYSAALILVSPSFYEGFGMPALEAMACGTVPIVSNRSSLPEVVGDVGLLIDPDDPESIAAAMQRALTDETWRTAEGHRARERARRFTWQRSAEIALHAYTSLR